MQRERERITRLAAFFEIQTDLIFARLARPSGRGGTLRPYMSSIPEEVSEQLAAQLAAVVPAANADDLDERREAPALGDTASGWDSYEVWRRFIKDARARRHPHPAEPK